MTDTNTFELYVDLDGVLVDFEATALKIAGIAPDSQGANKQLRHDFWKHIERHVKKGHKFFEIMDPMPDAAQLWEFVVKYNPTICSATGHVQGAATEKRNWVRTHLGRDVAARAIFVRDGVQKAQYAAPYHVLIDDRVKVINAWIEAGGIGILHTSAEDTIQQLQELGL